MSTGGSTSGTPATGSNYISRATLRSYIGVSSTVDDTILDACIEAAQGEIDAFCKRSFLGTTGTRYYREDDLIDLGGSEGSIAVGLDGGRTAASVGYSRRVLWLGKDLAALGGLTNGDETTIASTDCWVEPRNDPPYQYIRLKSAEAWSFGTDGEIAVSGTWGYAVTCPNAIIEYTKETAAYLYRMRDAPVFDVVAEPASGTITVPKGMPAHVKMGLEKGGWVRRRVIV